VRLATALAIAILSALPASAQPDTSLVVPGVRVGPVALGMDADAARAAAARFERETGCTIDIAIAADRVIAAGTRFGGCLSLELPADARPAVVQAGTFLLPLAAGIGGPAAALVNAFGQPRVTPLGGDQAALVWPQGLAAHVGGVSHMGGIVTYLAVVALGTREAPRIGHFASGTPPSP